MTEYRPHPAEGPDLGRTPVSRDPLRALPARCSCWPDELYEGCDLHGRAAQPDVWPRLDALDADIARARALADDAVEPSILDNWPNETHEPTEDDDACPNCGARDSNITADRVTCRRCGTEALNA